jgi:S-adenosylmethionine:tRNA ribosyltransferase-isomerase
MNIPLILTEDYDYILPQEKIAQYPLPERDASKLLIYTNGECNTDSYKNIASYLPPHSLAVFNNSKVIPARIIYIKETAGIIELFCLEPIQGTPYEALQNRGLSNWTCLIGGLKKWRKNSILQWDISTVEFQNIVSAKFIGQNENGFEIEFGWTHSDKTFADILELLGQMPIPPYLLRKAELDDSNRYQTMYATVEGSVAAPTAGLHFTEAILNDFVNNDIQTSYTTLHVGAGTFKPVNALYAHEHNMHAEWIETDINFIKQLLNYQKIIAIGTTSLRTIESLFWYAQICFKLKALPPKDFLLPQFIAYEADNISTKEVAFEYLIQLLISNDIERIIFKTELMILPSYSMKVASHLVTNFHQPKSTLLMLVNAFVKGNWKDVYEYALNHDYRFLSYGDGCLLEWPNN